MGGRKKGNESQVACFRALGEPSALARVPTAGLSRSNSGALRRPALGRAHSAHMGNCCKREIRVTLHVSVRVRPVLPEDFRALLHVVELPLESRPDWATELVPRAWLRPLANPFHKHGPMQVHVESAVLLGPERIAGETGARQVQCSYPVRDAILAECIPLRRPAEVRDSPVVHGGIGRIFWLVRRLR